MEVIEEGKRVKEWGGNVRSREEEWRRRENTWEDKHPDHTGFLLTFKTKLQVEYNASRRVCFTLCSTGTSETLAMNRIFTSPFCIHLWKLTTCRCPICAAATKNHRLGVFNNRHLFPSCGGGWAWDQGASVAVLVRATTWLAGGCLLAMSSHHGQRVSFTYKDSNPNTRNPLSWFRWTIITSPTLHFQIPSHCTLGLQHMNLQGGRGYKCLVYNNISKPFTRTTILWGNGTSVPSL